ncbi:MAG TPA: cupin domain-containing protein [Burkholderiales bacterium]|nr:cupin domain-containing protein [Burkholderiales bacterium]
MSKIGFLVVGVLGTASAALAQSVVQIMPEQIKWASAPAGVTKDTQAAVLAGPLDKPVPYTQRVRIAAGGAVTPHTHPDARYTTVLSGVLTVGLGENYDAAKETRYPAGSFVVMPGGQPHYSLAKDGEVVYQESGYGPTGTSFLKK